MMQITPSIQPRTSVLEPVGQTVRPKLLVAIPFYKSERLVERLLNSLIDCKAELNALQAEVVLYNDSPEYPPLVEALSRAAMAVGDGFPCRIETNPVNLGFVATMNRAFSEAAERRLDLLILNSDTVVTAGALTEMAAVMNTDPMIGVVCPRSNNATLCTLPWGRAADVQDPEAARRAAAAIAERLPRVSYVPTGVGFCMLIRAALVREFGGFDPAYGAGYNEENDFVMRINRCGYRAALANRAFVWHEGEASFAQTSVVRRERDRANADLLRARYPEYEGLVAAYFASPQHRAERLLSQLLAVEDGRIDIAFDFSGFGAFHNGTMEAGRRLLGEAARNWTDAFSISVLCAPETWAFHGFEQFPGVVRRDPHGASEHAILIRFGQPFDWNAVERTHIKAAIQALVMLDTIAWDCGYLSSQHLNDVWSAAVGACDVLITNSQFSLDQLRRRFDVRDDIVQLASLHSVDPRDYRHPTPKAPDIPPGYLLVIGNHYAHKYLAPTLEALAAARPWDRIVALGATGEEPILRRAANISPMKVGELSEEQVAGLFGCARAVVFPSHYEGFGFPIMHALANERPVFARDLPVYREIAAETNARDNIHLFETTDDLLALLARSPAWAAPSAPPGSGWTRSAAEIRGALERAAARPEYRRIVARLERASLVGHLTATAVAAVRAREAQPQDRAHRVATNVTRWLQPKVAAALSSPWLYSALQTSWRVLFWIKGRMDRMLGRSGRR